MSLIVELGSQDPAIVVDFGSASPADIEAAVRAEQTRAEAAEAALRTALAEHSTPNLHASVGLDDLAPALRTIINEIPASWNVDGLRISIYNQEGGQQDLNLTLSRAVVTEATGGVVKAVADSANRITFTALDAQGGESTIVAEKAAGGAGNSSHTDDEIKDLAGAVWSADGHLRYDATAKTGEFVVGSITTADLASNTAVDALTADLTRTQAKLTALKTLLGVAQEGASVASRVTALSALPAVGSADNGDIVNVGGILWERVEASDSGHTLRLTAGTSGNYIGAQTIGSAADYGSIDGGYKGTVEWAPSAEGVRLQGIRLDGDVLGQGAPPANLYARFTADSGEVIEAVLPRVPGYDLRVGGTAFLGYASGTTGERFTAPSGSRVEVDFFDSATFRTPFSIHSDDRWERWFERQIGSVHLPTQAGIEATVQRLRPNAFTSAEKAKLAAIPAGAGVPRTQAWAQGIAEGRVTALTRPFALHATSDANAAQGILGALRSTISETAKLPDAGSILQEGAIAPEQIGGMESGADAETEVKPLREAIVRVMDAAAANAPPAELLDYAKLKNKPSVIGQAAYLPVESEIEDNQIWNLDAEWEGFSPGIYRAIPTGLTQSERQSISVRFSRGQNAHAYVWEGSEISDNWRIAELTIRTDLANQSASQSIEAYLWSDHAANLPTLRLTFGAAGSGALWPDDGLSQTLARQAQTKTIGGRSVTRYWWSSGTSAGTPGSLAPDGVTIAIQAGTDIRAARLWTLDLHREFVLDEVNASSGGVHREAVADIDRLPVFSSLGAAQTAMLGNPIDLPMAVGNADRTVRWRDGTRVREGVVDARAPVGGRNGATTRRNRGIFTLVDGEYDSFDSIGSQAAFDSRIRSDPNHFVSKISVSVNIYGSPAPGGQTTRLMLWQMDLSERFISSQQQNINLNIQGALGSFSNLQLRSIRRFQLGGQWYRRYAATDSSLQNARGSKTITIDFFEHRIGGSQGAPILYQSDSPYLSEGSGRQLPTADAVAQILSLESAATAHKPVVWFRGTESNLFSVWRGVGHDNWLSYQNPPAANAFPPISSLPDDAWLTLSMRTGSQTNCGLITSRMFPARSLKELPDLTSVAGGQTAQRVRDREYDSGVAVRSGNDIINGQNAIRTTTSNAIQATIQGWLSMWLGNWGGRLAVRTQNRGYWHSDSVFDIHIFN